MHDSGYLVTHSNIILALETVLIVSGINQMVT